MLKISISLIFFQVQVGNEKEKKKGCLRLQRKDTGVHLARAAVHEHVHRLLELRADEREHDAQIPQQRLFVHLGQPEMILIIHSAFHRLLWAGKCGDQL